MHRLMHQKRMDCHEVTAVTVDSYQREAFAAAVVKVRRGVRVIIDQPLATVLTRHSKYI